MPSGRAPDLAGFGSVAPSLLGGRAAGRAEPARGAPAGGRYAAGCTRRAAHAAQASAIGDPRVEPAPNASGAPFEAIQFGADELAFNAANFPQNGKRVANWISGVAAAPGGDESLVFFEKVDCEGASFQVRGEMWTDRLRAPELVTAGEAAMLFGPGDRMFRPSELVEGEWAYVVAAEHLGKYLMVSSTPTAIQLRVADSVVGEWSEAVEVTQGVAFNPTGEFDGHVRLMTITFE